MIEQLSLPKYESQIIHLLKDTFRVSYSLAQKRLEQTKRRCFQAELDEQFKTQTNKVFNYYGDDPERQRWKDISNSYAQLAILRKKEKELMKN